MFKAISNVESKSEVILKSKELKQLSSSLLKCYTTDNNLPNEECSKIAESLTFVHNKHITVNSVKLVSSRTLLYTLTSNNNTEYCIFFDIDNRKCQIYPSVYTLWSTIREDYSLLLPTIVINEEVSYYILNGAELMHPGIIYIDSCIRVGPMVAIRVLNNPLPFAVGKRVYV